MSEADSAVANASSLDDLKAALGLGGSANALGRWGRTALHGAASQGNVDMVKLLLAQPGINIDLADEDGYTPLLFAASTTRLEAVKALVEAGADLKASAGGETSLSLAAKSQNDTKEETIAYLTSKGAL